VSFKKNIEFSDTFLTQFSLTHTLFVLLNMYNNRKGKLIMCKTSCMIVMMGILVIWWLVAAALLQACWNRVIAKIWKMERAKYRQALLLIATICFLCVPCGLKKLHHQCCPTSKMCHSDCKDSKCCGDCHHDEEGSDKSKKKSKCPYHQE
jgi:hypothetical protein